MGTISKVGTLAMLALCGWLSWAESACAQTTVEVLASTEWVDTGIDVQASQRLRITASGSWSNGARFARWVGPNGWAKLHNSESLSPQSPSSSLVGRIAGDVFFVGADFQASASSSGRLFLSMNDVSGQFANNRGKVEATVTVSQSLAILAGQQLSDQEYVFLPANQVLALLKGIAFNGGRVQLSQTDEGRPITIGGFKRMSYISFGPALAGMGLGDIPVEIPVEEVSTEELNQLDTDAGGTSVWGQYLLTGNIVFIDNMRFLLNNIHADFDNDLEVALGDGEVLLLVKLQSGDPAIRGEGNGFSGIPFGIPYPLGWEDGLAPDINLSDPLVTIHLKPALDDKGKLFLLDPDVDVKVELSLTQLDWMISNERKDGYKDIFEKQLRAQLRDPKTKTAIETAMVKLLLGGRANADVLGIKIDSNGIETTFKKVSP